MSHRKISERSLGRRWGWAVLAVGLAIPLQKLLHAMLPAELPFLPFALAVLVSCRWGGAVGGAIATAASAFVLFNWFLPPAASFLDERGLGLSLFVAAGLCVTYQAATQPKPKPLVKMPPVATEEPVSHFEYIGSAA